MILNRKMSYKMSGVACVVTLAAAAAVLPTLFGAPAIAQQNEEFSADDQRLASVESSNNLKQILLAMHNYYADHQHLPPAVVIGPDGKTPHSWRVALLPHLQLQHLYDEYRLNEPWDSPHNRKLLAKLPHVFRNPMDPGDSTKTAYFVFTGPETVFPNGKGTHIKDIVDGTSSTLMIVEAKRDIPWTKPEDIPYDAKKPFSTVGGYYDKGFFAASCAGSTYFVRKHVPEKHLKAAITKAGLERIGSTGDPLEIFRTRNAQP